MPTRRNQPSCVSTNPTLCARRLGNGPAAKSSALTGVRTHARPRSRSARKAVPCNCGYCIVRLCRCQPPAACCTCTVWHFHSRAALSSGLHQAREDNPCDKMGVPRMHALRLLSVFPIPFFPNHASAPGGNPTPLRSLAGGIQDNIPNARIHPAS